MENVLGLAVYPPEGGPPPLDWAVWNLQEGPTSTSSRSSWAQGSLASKLPAHACGWCPSFADALLVCKMTREDADDLLKGCLQSCCDAGAWCPITVDHLLLPDDHRFSD